MNETLKKWCRRYMSADSVEQILDAVGYDRSQGIGGISGLMNLIDQDYFTDIAHYLATDMAVFILPDGESIEVYLTQK